MKKNLLVLPLLMGAVLLGGCDPNGGGTGGANGNKVVLDFASGEIDFDFIDDLETNKPFEYNGMTYNDVGCYDSVYGDNTYLSFALKKIAGDGKVVEGEPLPYIGNAEAFNSDIKSIDIDVSVQTGGVDFYVVFGSEELGPFAAGSVSGKKKTVQSSTAASFTVDNTSGGKYFAIVASKGVDQYRKNGGLAKITINF